MNDRSGSRDSTADASADNGSGIPSFVAAVLASDGFEVVVDVVMALRIESNGEGRGFAFWVAPKSGSSNASINSFSCFLAATNAQKKHANS